MIVSSSDHLSEEEEFQVVVEEELGEWVDGTSPAPVHV